MGDPGSVTTVLEVDLAGTPTAVTVMGDGPPVLLVPGGGARCPGYFPGLDALVGEASLILHERPGAEEGSPALSLADQARMLRRVVDAVGRGPAIVVGHSLGGPVTAQLVVDHPEVVAAVLLLDPTPFTEDRITRRLSPSMRLISAWERTPGLRRLLARLLIRTATKRLADPITPEVRVAIDQIVDPEMARRASRRLRGFDADARALTERLEADPVSVPGVIATADRKATSALRKAHQRIGALLGTDVEVWEGTDHTMHFEDPERVVATLRRLLAVAPL
jgi:pimeloyl-ACP methyl ester carboxylesterase